MCLPRNVGHVAFLVCHSDVDRESAHVTFALRQKCQALHRNLNLDRHLEEIFRANRRANLHQNAQIVRLRLVEQIRDHSVVHFRECRLLDEGLPVANDIVPVLDPNFEVALPVDALRPGAVSEGVVGLEVTLDVAESLREVVGVDRRETAGHLRHELQGLRRVAERRLRDRVRCRLVHFRHVVFVRRSESAGVDCIHRDAVRIRGLGDFLDLRAGVEAHSFEHRRSGLPAFFATHLIDEIEHLAARLHLKAFRRQNENFLALDSG